MNDTVATLPKPYTAEAGALNRKRFAALRDGPQKMTPRQIARELDFLEVYIRRQLKKYDAERLSASESGSSVESPRNEKGPR